MDDNFPNPAPAPARRGKIATLPAKIREDLCQRMHDGQQGPQLLPWLNGLPEVLDVLDRLWREQPITDSNLSDWRQGGFQDWLRKREAVERTRILADYCRAVGEAGAGELGLPAALAGGALMEVLEGFDASGLKMMLAENPSGFVAIITAMANLQTSQAKAMQAKSGAEAVKQRDKALAQRDEQLAQLQRRLDLAEREQERREATAFLKWAADDEAKRIALDTTKSEPVKIQLLMKRMFGERPADLAEPAPAAKPLSGG